MKTILVMGLLTLSSTAFSSVLKSYDTSKSCTLYRVTTDNTKVKQINETIFYPKEVYGISMEDLDVDFDNHQVKAQVVMSIVMGINKPLVEGQMAIEEGNTQFKMLVNQVNRKLFLLEKVCISADKKIVYGKVMENK